MPDDDIKRSILEQHLGTVLQIMVVGLLGWSLLTTQNMSKEVEVLKFKVEAVSVTLAQGTTDRYRGTDAARDFAAVRHEMAYLEKRLADLEGKAARR